MSITLNIHMHDGDTPSASLVASKHGQPFVAVQVSEYPADVSVLVASEAQADGLVAAFTEAKRLFAPASDPFDLESLRELARREGITG